MAREGNENEEDRSVVEEAGPGLDVDEVEVRPGELLDVGEVGIGTEDGDWEEGGEP